MSDQHQQQPSQDEQLARQAQQNLNLNAPSFSPDAAAFTPGAPSFVPGGQAQGQYYPQGQYQQQQQHQQQPPPQQQQAYQPQQYYRQPQHQPYGHQQAYQQNYQQPYQQPYGSQSQYQQRNHHQNSNNQRYGQPQQQQPVHNPPAQPRTYNPNVRYTTSGAAATSGAAQPGLGGQTTSKAPPAKVLSLGSDGIPSKPKVLSLGTDGAPKVLSLSATGEVEKTPAKAVTEKPKETDDDKGVSGAEAVAKRAIDKTGQSTPNTRSAPESPAETPRSATPAEPAPVEPKSEIAVEEQLTQVDDAAILEVFGKEHLNVIFLGHVDAGKSTLGGSILVSTGVVDNRTLEKYRKEAKDSGNESWYLSWVMDQNKEERADGKTIEVGQGFFETEHRRFTILDAPGHKSYVSNMIGGASQADMGVLVISARKGEYETGFEKGGQTREHALLAKTQGVNKLVVAVNKMDDPTVEWSEERYKQCIAKPASYLKGIGYNPSTDLIFIPVAGQSSSNVRDPVDPKVCPWYKGPSLLDVLNTLDLPDRKLNAPLMMPITLKMKDMGTVLKGKIEAGMMKKDQKYCIMPNKTTVTVTSIKGETEQEIDQAICGDQVQISVRGVDEEDVKVGFVLCSLSSPVHAVRAIEAHIMLLEVKSILVAGYQCMMHVHTSTEPVYFDALLHKLQKGTNRRSKNPPMFAVKGMNVIARLVVQDPNSRICVEKFEDYNQLGRFTIRDQDQTVAIGKVTKLLTDY